MKFFIFLLTMALNYSLFAAEGLFAIKDLKTSPGYRDSYVEFKGCGGVRIHKDLPYVLTALHCVTNVIGKIEPSSVIELGNHFASDQIVQFSDLKGKVLPGGIKVLSSGRCFTGLDPEVLAEESKEKIKKALACALEDWAILEVPSIRAQNCSPIAKNNSIDIIALGATTKLIKRNTGLNNLKGNVFTRGHVYQIRQLINLPQYLFNSLWIGLVDEFENTMSKQFILSDGDVMNGMSGGPVLDNSFSINGVTTTALLPVNIWKFEGAKSFEEGYNFGIHGAISISQIILQLNKKSIDPNKFFLCK